MNMRVPVFLLEIRQLRVVELFDERVLDPALDGVLGRDDDVDAELPARILASISSVEPKTCMLIATPVADVKSCRTVGSW